MKSEKARDLHDKSFWNVNLEKTFLDTKHKHKVNKNSGDSSLPTILRSWDRIPSTLHV